MKTYDPKLREAIQEISAIIAKHDCMGLVQLQSKTHGEFLMQVEGPTWSYLKYERDAKGEVIGIRIKAKGVKKDTPEAENLTSTVAAICDFADMSSNWSRQMYQIKDLLNKQMKIEHDPLGHHRITNEDR